MRVWCLVAVLMAGLCGVAAADGCYIPKIDPGSAARDLTEPTQKAIIVHLGGTERLILQVSFRGNVSEFAWLIPTPSRPTVTTADARLFERFHLATAPTLRYWLSADEWDEEVSEGLLFAMAAGRTEKPAERPKVDVLERRVIGNYDAAVLKAENEGDLLQWLRSNGYAVRDAMRPVLADYIRRRWVFTAVRIVDSAREESAKGLSEGSLAPLQLQFPSDQPVYPLKISSLNPGRTKVLVYVVGRRVVSGDSLSTECSVDDEFSRHWDYISPFVHAQIDELTREDSFDPRGQHRYCVTKLTAELDPEQMTEDVVFHTARDQYTTGVRQVSPSLLENIGAVVLMPITLACTLPVNLIPCLICGIFAYVHRKSKKAENWQIAQLILFIAWLPLYFIVLALKQIGYWPVGLAVVIGVPLAVAAKRRRIRKRPEPEASV